MEKPGGCWAYLPVSDHNWWPLCNTLAQIFPKNDDSVANWPCHTLWHRHVCGILLNEVIFLTVNLCGPLPVRKLHSTGETIVWRDPGGSWACLRPVSDYERTCTFRGCRWHVKHICLWRFCEAGRFSYGESPRTLPREGTSLHRRNSIVERPWGILGPFTTRFRLRVNSHFQRL